MWTPKQLALAEPPEWLGDCHPLVEQLGSAEGLLSLASVSSLLRVLPVNNVEALREFLRSYQTRILFPLELAVIERAFQHAFRNELRELIELDRELAEETALKDFTSASLRVGQTQLQKLRPLRDQRIVRRYLDAVVGGKARGWHTIVYGITLAMYSLPLRQGLLGYAFQTTRGFIYSAARDLQLSEEECRALLEELSETLPAAVEAQIGSRAAA